MNPEPHLSLAVDDLGRAPYVETLDRQRRLQAAVVAGREQPGPPTMHLLLVEHDPPVITVPRRPGAAAHVTSSETALAAAGIAVEPTDRGGDVTYHGPGQLVAYPILDLNVLGLRLHGYMRFLEAMVLETIAALGVTGHRDSCATGVWVGGDGRDDAKIAAMGVRVSRWVTMHGLALNVDPDLDHYRHLVPCGLVGRPVTSLAQELGSAPPMDDVKRVFVERFRSGVEHLASDASARHD